MKDLLPPLPLWSAPRPRRGKTYAREEFDTARYSVRGSATCEAFRAEANAFANLVASFLAADGNKDDVCERIFRDVTPSSTLATALEIYHHDTSPGNLYGTFRCGLKENRRPDVLEAAFALVADRSLEPCRLFMREAADPALYLRSTPPQAVLDCARASDLHSMRALAFAILHVVHAVPFGRYRNGVVPDENDVWCENLSVADVFAADRAERERYDASRKLSDASRHATLLKAVQAVRQITTRHLPAVNRKLNALMPGTSVERTVSSGHHVARLHVAGMGSWNGPPVGKEKAVAGLFRYLELLSSLEPGEEWTRNWMIETQVKKEFFSTPVS